MDRIAGITLLIFATCHVYFCMGQVSNGSELFTDTPSELTDNGTDSGFPPIGENVLSSSIDKGMIPIYDFTKFFLDNIVAVNQIVGLNNKVNLTDEEAVLESLGNNWELWIEHYIAFTIATLIGALFFVFMPLIGCCICCCRNRGNCGGNEEPIETSYAKCQRITCGAVLLTFSVLILLAVTSCFLSTSLVRDQTVPSGTMKDISSSLESLDLYFENTQDQIWRLRDNYFEGPYNHIQHKLKTFPLEVQDQVGTATEAEPLFNELENYVDAIPEVTRTLNETEWRAQSLDNQAADLNKTLENLISSFQVDFESCNLDQCNTSKTLMAALQMVANFTGQDLSPVIADIEAVLVGPENITASLQEGRDEFDKIRQVVEFASNETLSGFSVELENYATEFYAYINESTAKISSMNMSKERQNINQTISKEVDDIGYYAYISLNGVCSIALLLVALFFLGLLFGCCGDRAGDDAAFCNRGNGSTTLVVAMVMFFLLSWILMISTTAMFLGGGLSYTEICRQFIFQESQDDLDVVDEILSSYLNISGASALTIMSNCDQDLPFYQAFEVEKHYPQLNISNALDLSGLNLEGVFEELLSRDYSIGNVTMLNNVAKEHLQTIENALQNVDISFYETLSLQNITNYSLQELSTMFDTFAEELDTLNPTEATLFRQYSVQLSESYNNQVINITQGMGEISTMITLIKTYDASMNLSVYIPEMESAQDSITSQEIVNAVNETINVIFDDLMSLADSIVNTVVNLIGPCYSVYNALSVSISSVCVSFLYPFNAFWFSMGCSLFFFTLSIPVVFTLITSYRKSTPYVSEQEVVGRPRLHRGRSNRSANGLRSSLVPERGQQHRHSGHQGDGDMARMPSAPPPPYDGADNNGFIPDDPEFIMRHPDYENSAIIEVHAAREAPSRGNPSRGNPVRPTQNYVIELRPRNALHQRQHSDNTIEDYF